MLDRVLDDAMLSGPHAARVTIRPLRYGAVVDADDIHALLEEMRQACQFWGGANAPFIVAADGQVTAAYGSMLAGSALDWVTGMELFDLYRPSEARSVAPGRPERWGRQLAAPLLDYQNQDHYLPLEVVELAADDPWRGIYAACLGDLPAAMDRQFLVSRQYLHDLTYEDFLHVRRVRVTGSFEDLLARLDREDVLTPRAMSMIDLPYGTRGSTALRTEHHVLPEPGYPSFDAGPNVVIVCGPGSVADLALLWNLRAAHGDEFVLPIGLPVAEASSQLVTALAQHPSRARNGMTRRGLYITSASLSTEALHRLLPDVGDAVGFAGHEQMLTFGQAAGWHYEEVLVWNEGVSSLVPSAEPRYREVLSKPGISQYTGFAVDVVVPGHPFPRGGDVRCHGLNWTFAAGAATRHIGRSAETVAVAWPSRMLAARAVCSRRGLRLTPSEPGRAAMVVLAGLGSVGELAHLAHAPLLELLATMAARQGMSWYKKRLRERGSSDSWTLTPSTAEDLPEQSFDAFRRVVGGNDGAARRWLLWAEQAGLVVKGFPLECASCQHKQWTPVAAFAPPIICRGCARPMSTPFGDRARIDFKYRLSERLRRVYEHDAIGHLLVLRYFAELLDGRLVGIHPGMEVRGAAPPGGTTDSAGPVLGEADDLLVLSDAAIVPVEVKSTFAGVVPGELDKLEALAALLGSPWSAIAVCQYGKEAREGITALQRRGDGAEPHRIVLGFDRLLDLHPTWLVGEDPFAWDPLTAQQVTDREAAFVRILTADVGEGKRWLDYSMMRVPGT